MSFKKCVKNLESVFTADVFQMITYEDLQNRSKECSSLDAVRHFSSQHLNVRHLLGNNIFSCVLIIQS